MNVPWLRFGPGGSPQQGGCIMQIVSWISTGGWTDRPGCVHRILRDWGIFANDAMTDEGRQRLLGLAPRFLNTKDMEFTTLLEIRAVQNEFLVYWNLSIKNQVKGPRLDEALYNALVKMLDTHDKMEGRTKVVDVDYAPVCEVLDDRYVCSR